MALTWDTSGCVLALPLNDDERQQLETLVFLGWQVEAGDLTADSHREWMVRILLLQHLTGMSAPFGNNEALYQALKRWHGLKLNVSFVPKTSWIASRVGSAYESVGRQADRLIEESEMFSPLGSCGSN